VQRFVAADSHALAAPFEHQLIDERLPVEMSLNCHDCQHSFTLNTARSADSSTATACAKSSAR